MTGGQVLILLVGLYIFIRIGIWIGRTDNQGIDDKPTTWAGKPDNPRFATWEAAMNRPTPGAPAFWIEYSDEDGVITERTIKPLSIHLKKGRAEVAIRAYCDLREAERTFLSERILQARNLTTDRVIKDIGSYLRGKY